MSQDPWRSGGGAPAGGATAPDLGRGALQRPPEIATLHAERLAALAAGRNPADDLKSCYLLGGILDDVLEVADRRLQGPLTAWSRGVQRYASLTANEDKDFYSDTPDALGAHVALAQGECPTTVTPKYNKISAVLSDCAIWLQLADDGGWHAPFAWLESLNGSLGWLAQFFRRIRLLRRPVGALVAAMRHTGAPTLLRRGGAATEAIRRIVALTEGGKLRPTCYFRSASLLAASITTAASGAAPDPEDQTLRAALDRACLQAYGSAGPARNGLLGVATTASDAGCDRTGAAWGLVTDGGEETDPPTAYHAIIDPTLDSGHAELLPVLHAAERCFSRWRGRLVCIRTDNLGNAYRINEASCAVGSPCFPILDRIFELADLYDIELLALWVPRAANAELDSLADTRSPAGAQAWASRTGIRLG